MDLKIYNPEVRVSQQIGANSDNMKKVIPRIGALMWSVTTVVIGLLVHKIMSDFYEHSQEEQLFLDSVGMSDRHRLNGIYEGICW